MAMLPMAMYGLEVPAGDVAISGKPDVPSAFRITMAAIDPSAEPEGEDGAIPRATLKVIRQSLLEDSDLEDSDDEFDQEQMERLLAEEYSDESEDDEDVNGGPSDPTKSKKARVEAAKKEVAKILEEGNAMDVDDVPNGVNGIAKSSKAKGKMPASDEDEDESEDSEEDDEDYEGGEIEEYVICTLDPNKVWKAVDTLIVRH